MTTEDITATHLTLIEGGKDQEKSVPAELQPIFAAMTSHYQSLREASQALEQKVADMEDDWDIRSKSFWEGVLSALKTLKSKVQGACASLVQDREIGRTPLGFIGTRYELMTPLYHTESLIENAGIALTAYLPHCQSRVESRLQQRQQILHKLQQIISEIQTVLLTLGEKGQARCLAEHKHCLQELAERERSLQKRKEKKSDEQAQETE